MGTIKLEPLHVLDGVIDSHAARKDSIRRAYRAGVKLPPIRVARDPESGRIAILDGFHRYAVAVEDRWPTVLVEWTSSHVPEPPRPACSRCGAPESDPEPCDHTRRP